jgi:hypothetical protein
VRVKEKSKDYYGFWYDAAGKKHSLHFLNCRDKDVAQGLLNDHLKQLGRVEAGLEVHPNVDKAARGIALEDHLQDYLRDLCNKGRAERYVSEQERLTRVVLEGVGATVLADLKPEKVYQFVAALTNRVPRKGEAKAPPASARTKETHRQAICAMTAWLASPSVRRVPTDPLVHVPPFRGVSVRNRRALTEIDLQKLLDAARERPLANTKHLLKGGRREQPAQLSPEREEALRRHGVQRALVYKMAVLTLARFGAIHRLTDDALHLDDEPPHAFFPPTNVKGRRTITKALHSNLVQDLRDWLTLTGKKGHDRVFNLNSQITRELRKDLAYAGIPYKDSQGQSLDFHAFKKSGVTALARARVDVLKVRDFAEHKDVRLTTTAYHDALGESMDDVLEGLPKIN